MLDELDKQRQKLAVKASVCFIGARYNLFSVSTYFSSQIFPYFTM